MDRLLAPIPAAPFPIASDAQAVWYLMEVIQIDNFCDVLAGQVQRKCRGGQGVPAGGREGGRG